MKELHKTDKKEFASALTSVSAIYNHNLDKGATHIYWHILKDYGITPIKKALYSHLKDPEQGKFFPKPCDIIQRIDGKPSDKAILAWAKLIKFLNDNSINEKPVIFDDPIIHYCVDVMGGLDNVRGKPSEESFKRKEFIDTYNAAMNDKASYVKNYSNILNVSDIELPFKYKKFLTKDELVNEIDSIENEMPTSFVYETYDHEYLSKYENFKNKSNEIFNKINSLKLLLRFYDRLSDTVMIGDKKCLIDVVLKGKYKIHDFIMKPLNNSLLYNMMPKGIIHEK